MSALNKSQTRPVRPAQPYTFDALTDYVENLTTYMQSTKKGTMEKEEAIQELCEANAIYVDFIRRMPKRPVAPSASGAGAV